MWPVAPSEDREIRHPGSTTDLGKDNLLPSEHSKAGNLPGVLQKKVSFHPLEFAMHRLCDLQGSLLSPQGPGFPVYQTQKWEGMALKVPRVSGLVSPRFPRPKFLSLLGCVTEGYEWQGTSIPED